MFSIDYTDGVIRPETFKYYAAPLIKTATKYEDFALTLGGKLRDRNNGSTTSTHLSVVFDNERVLELEDEGMAAARTANQAPYGILELG